MNVDLRDYFAAIAMQSIIQLSERQIQYLYGTTCISKAAYYQADKMLEERLKHD